MAAGLGPFLSKFYPFNSSENIELRGLSIFDLTIGSLRLTKLLFDNIEDILLEAARLAQGDPEAENLFIILMENFKDLKVISNEERIQDGLISNDYSDGSSIVDVILEGEKAIYDRGGKQEEVEILSFVYTRDGIKYNLRHDNPTVKWQASARYIFPIPGVTKMGKYDINTGEMVEE